MKAPITTAQAMSHPDVATIINSLGRIADELRTERDELAAENKVLRKTAQLAMDALDTCKETMTGTRFKYRDYDERRVARAKAALKEATNG